MVLSVKSNDHTSLSHSALSLLLETFSVLDFRDMEIWIISFLHACLLVFGQVEGITWTWLQNSRVFQGSFSFFLSLCHVIESHGFSHDLYIPLVLASTDSYSTNFLILPLGHPTGILKQIWANRTLESFSPKPAISLICLPSLSQWMIVALFLHFSNQKPRVDFNLFLFYSCHTQALRKSSSALLLEHILSYFTSPLRCFHHTSVWPLSFRS